MPRGDGTGPMGAGPQTGRSAGYCAGKQTPGFASAPGGRGSGGGRRLGAGGGRGGRGRRNQFYATGLTGRQRAAAGAPASGSAAEATPPTDAAPTSPASEDELAQLKRGAEGLVDALEKLTTRIAELEAARQEE
jgi:hypothetical protein